jgi:hypothetical protein
MAHDAIASYRNAMTFLENSRFEPGVSALRTVIDSGSLPDHLLPDAHANLGVSRALLHNLRLLCV